MLKVAQSLGLDRGLYVGGSFSGERAQESEDIINPATEIAFGRAPVGSLASAADAIQAARTAFDRGPWPALPWRERVAFLDTMYRALAARANDICELIIAEAGAVRANSRARQFDIPMKHFRHYLDAGERTPVRALAPELTPGAGGIKTLGTGFVVREPVGVVAAITPYNYPFFLNLAKVVPALLTGNTVVLKPSPYTPFEALVLATAADEAGLPPGVFNVITGSPVEIGGELTSNPIVRKLSFTGSTEVGKLLMAQCAGTIKKISLELGGNAPFIVFDDADIDAAIEGATASKYRNTGQTCISTNRFYVQDAIYDAFAAKLTQAVKNLKPASGLEAGATQGPLIDDAALTKVETHLNDAKSKGAKVLIGGNRHSLGGRFFEPTVLADVTPQMRISKEETFGPVAPLFRFKNEAEAVALANDTEFGLAAYFYGRDIARIWRVAEALEYGIVGINTGMISTEVAPFGGFKESGLGREGSKYGMDDYLEIKYLCFGGIS